MTRKPNGHGAGGGGDPSSGEASDESARLLIRFADRIHDGPMQHIVGAKMWLDSIPAAELSPGSIVPVQTALAALTSAIAELRGVMSELRSEISVHSDPADLSGGDHG